MDLLLGLVAVRLYLVAADWIYSADHWVFAF